MSKRAIVLSLGLAVIAIATSALAIEGSPMQERRRWSQFCEQSRVQKAEFKDAFESFNSRIKVLGGEGWELVTMALQDDDGGTRLAACFKRETR
ncbi:MAG: hypothetical protein IT381_11905 [Deltaproteobacteria bacterium]|nr:hypothetical protein [Deltaproteobacteria bacterium]